MHTLSSGRKARQLRQVSGTCRLALAINATVYFVRPLQPHPEVSARAVRLTKTDGTIYDVAITTHGAECSCPDFTFHRQGKDPKGCKHIAALRAVGLLP